MARTKKTKNNQKFDPYKILEVVKSSNVLKMGWHEGKTYVLYKGEVLYVFDAFTEEQYWQIRKAESIGKALFATGAKGVKYKA